MKLTKKGMLFLVVFFSCILIVSACSNDEEETNAENDESNNEKEESDDKDENDTESNVNNNENDVEEKETDTEDFKSDLGNKKVWFGGEVEVSEDEIVVEGKSNLLPDTPIHSGGISGDWAVIDFQDSTNVEDDGSFSFTFPGKSDESFGRLEIGTGTEETDEKYGENLEKVEGSHVYLTENEGEFDVKTTFIIDPKKEMPYTVPLEFSDWEEPEDYGDEEIWMEVDYTTDHDYIYFDGKSNIMEGAQVGGNLRDGSGQIVPFAHKHTSVEPDGSFQFKVRYNDLREGTYMPIKFELDEVNNSWDHLVDAYGENGEKMKGDLIKEDDDGNNYAELQLEIDAPDMEPPEEVDITESDEEMKLQVPDDVLFDFDESKLKSDAKETLDELIGDLEELVADTELEINGHTDDEGDADYNMDLSEERAESVMDYVEDNSDIADQLDIEVEGYGETDPIDSNDDSDGRERNRRVEIVINPE